MGSSQVRFCPDCGASVRRPGQRFCDQCSYPLEDSPIADALAAEASGRPSLASQVSVPSPASAPTARGGVSGPDLTSAAIVMAVPVIAWLALTAIVMSSLAALTTGVSLPLFGPVASLLAGFGYSVSASAGTDYVSAAHGSVSLAAEPILSLMIIGGAAAIGARLFGARRATHGLPLPSWCVLSAGIGAIAMWLVAMASVVTLGADLGKMAGAGAGALGYGGVGSLLDSLGLGASIKGTPGVLGAIPLFGVLLLGVGFGTGWLRPGLLLAPRGRWVALWSGVGLALAELGVIAALTLLGWCLFSVLNIGHIRDSAGLLWGSLFAVPNVVMLAGATVAGAGLGVAQSGTQSAPFVLTGLHAVVFVMVAGFAVAGGMWLSRVTGSGRAALTKPGTYAQAALAAVVAQGLLLAGGFLASGSMSSSGAAINGYAQDATIVVGSSLSPLIAATTLAVFVGLLAGIGIREAIAPYARRATRRAKGFYREARTRGLRATFGLAKRSYFGLPRPAKVALPAIPVLLILTFLVVSTVNSADYRLQHTIGDLANRQVNTQLLNAAGYATLIGLIGVPADVTVTVQDWKSKQVQSYYGQSDIYQASYGQSDIYQASWRFDAERGGTKLTTTSCTATFSRDSNGTFSVADSSCSIPIAQLLTQAKSPDEVKRLVSAAQTANQAFGSHVSVASATAADTANLPTPETTDDPAMLAGQRETDSEALPAEVETWSYSVDGTAYPLYSRVVKPAVTAKIRVGTLDPDILKASAMAAFSAFNDARGAGNVQAALAVLSHAGGLTASGLKASAIALPTTDLLQIGGQKGAYVVTAGSSTSAPDGSGVWRIDYSGQPLANLPVTGHLHYDGPVLGGSSGRPSPVDIDMTPISTVGGQSTFDLHFVAQVQAGDRSYNDELVLVSIAINGQTVDAEKRVICHFSGTSAPADCTISGVALPSATFDSVSVHVLFAFESWGEQVWAETTFVANS